MDARIENEPPAQHQQPPPGLPHRVLASLNDTTAPYAPTQDERTLAMLIHLLMLLTGLVGPLIVWLVRREDSHYLDHHGKESLNFLISNFIYIIPLLFLTIITLGLAAVLLIPSAIFFGVFLILACIQGYQGTWYRFPLTIRLLR